MAKSEFDKYFAAAKAQQLAKAALRAAENNLRDVLLWHLRHEQLYAALNSTPGNKIVLMDGPKPKWEFGMYGNPAYKLVRTATTYGETEVLCLKTNSWGLWRVECDAKAAELFWGDYPDIAKYNLAAIESAQIEVQRCAQRYNAAIAATIAAEQLLQE